MKHVKTLMPVLVFTCLITGSVWAHSQSLPKAQPYFSALSPIFGFDPAYGVLLGGAWFSYPTGLVPEATVRKSLNLVSRLGPHGVLSYAQQNPGLFGRTGLDSQLMLNNLYDYDTNIDSAQISQRHNQLKLAAKLTLRQPLNDRWQLFGGAHSEWQTHARNGQHYASYGFSGLQYDRRDNPDNSHRGALLSLQLNLQPDVWNDQASSNSAQLQFDGRWFVPLAERHTLAVHALAETSIGTGLDSQAGGDRMLRGYLGGQYRAPHMLAGQVEYRFPIWSFIQGVAFVDAANLIHADEQLYKTSTGVGLRFGLPPDHTMSVRVDMALNDAGQLLSYVNFNQVF